MSLTYPPTEQTAELSAADHLSEAWRSQRRLTAALAGLPRAAKATLENNKAALAKCPADQRAALAAKMQARFESDFAAAVPRLVSLLECVAEGVDSTAPELAKQLADAIKG